MRLPALQRTLRAFTVVELLVVVLILVILGAILVSIFYERPQRPHRMICLVNLKNVVLGAYLWAADHGDRFPWQVATNGGTEELIGSGRLVPHFQAMSNQLVKTE